MSASLDLFPVLAICSSLKRKLLLQSSLAGLHQRGRFTHAAA